MTRKEHLLHRDHWWIRDFPDPFKYAKMVLDSESPPDKEMNTTPGRRLLIGEYSILKKSGDEKNMKKMSEAIVKLLDDPEYAPDAIPVAAELGLEEAKEWFLNLTKMNIQELREIKTNDFSNGFGCLIHYAGHCKESLSYLTHILSESTLTTGERLIVLKKISKHDSSFIYKNYKKQTEILLQDWNEQNGAKKHIIYCVFCEAFENSRLENCLSVGKMVREQMSEDFQLLYFNSLKQLPKYKPYLEELKKILEISE